MPVHLDPAQTRAPRPEQIARAEPPRHRQARTPARIADLLGDFSEQTGAHFG